MTESEQILVLQQAAELGNAKAALRLGQRYLQGKGVVASEVEAARWLFVAAKEDKQARVKLTEIFIRNPDAVEDQATVMGWLFQQASEYDVLACASLAICYERGLGVANDLGEAAKFLRLAAERGNLWSQITLADWCRQGIVGKPDGDECLRWLKKPLALGMGGAYRILGSYHLSDCAVRKNPAEAVKWFRKAATLRDPIAAYDLGCCYEDGIGVKKNLDEAAKWFSKSASRGYERARLRLAGIHDGRRRPTAIKKGSGGQIDPAWAQSLYQFPAGGQGGSIGPSRRDRPHDFTKNSLYDKSTSVGIDPTEKKRKGIYSLDLAGLRPPHSPTHLEKDVAKRQEALADLASLRKAAQITGVSLSTIQRAIESGRLTKHTLIKEIPAVKLSDCQLLWPKGIPHPPGRPPKT